MIIVEFCGGLGNQMFQYAFYKTLKYTYSAIKIKADLHNYKINKYHNGFELFNIFNIHLDKATIWECIKTGKRDYLNNYQNLILKNIYRILIFFYNRFFINKIKKNIYIKWVKSFDFDPSFFNLDINQNYYLSGYWINENYFNIIKDALFIDFQVSEIFNNSLIIKKIVNSESVSIHLRRGDYVGTEYDVLTNDYYKNAINYISDRIINPVFFIFSDDKEYAEKYFDYLPNKYLVSENHGNNSYKDMLLMSLCKHNINANSSFSFWGAYLNKNNKKIVVTPNIYLKNRQDYPVCKDWIIIDCIKK